MFKATRFRMRAPRTSGLSQYSMQIWSNIKEDATWMRLAHNPIDANVLICHFDLYSYMARAICK